MNRNDYAVEIVSLTDSVYGVLDGQGSCEVPATVQAEDFMRCEFSEAPEPNVRERVHNNVVTVSARPAGSTATRANTVSATDQAWVLFREDKDPRGNTSHAPWRVLVSRILGLLRSQKISVRTETR